MDFDQRRANFDKKFKSFTRWEAVLSVLSVTVSLGVLGFLGWVIVMVMKHFEII